MELFEEKSNNNQEPQKEGKAYSFYQGNHLQEGEEPLSRVVGHENQKKELLAVIEWF